MKRARIRMDKKGEKRAKNGTQQLIQAVQAGERVAIEQLIHQEQPRIYRFGMKMCGNREDASDILQDTLISMVQHIEEFKGHSSLSTWLYSIARSYCIKKRRKGKFQPQREQSLESDTDIHQLTDPSDTPEERVADIQLRESLDQAIASLAPKYREVLILRDIEGFTTKEVSDILEIGIANIKSRLHRARALLRDKMENRLEGNNATSLPNPDADCPDVVSLLSAHLEGELSQKICQQMEKHIESCAPCRRRCDSLKKTIRLCSTSSTPDIPENTKQAVRQALQKYLASLQTK